MCEIGAFEAAATEFRRQRTDIRFERGGTTSEWKSKALPSFPRRTKDRCNREADACTATPCEFDGYRIQLHKAGATAVAFGKNGGDLTRRFPTIATAVRELPARSCIIDGELIAAGKHGEPDFLALLHGRHVPVCVYAFDLLELDGQEVRDEPLEKRRARLKRLLSRSKGKLLRFSDSFPDASVLLAECVRLGLEGIVAKRKDVPYRSGTRSGWVKVKCEGWKAANQWRGEFLRKRVTAAHTQNHLHAAVHRHWDCCVWSTTCADEYIRSTLRQNGEVTVSRCGIKI